MATKKTFTEQSAETRLIYERLRTMAVGEEVSYAELSGLISVDVQTKAYHNMRSAQKYARSVDEMVFEPVKGEGLRRLNNEQTVDRQAGRFKRVGRLAREARKDLATIDFDALPNPTKLRHNSYLAISGALEHQTRPKQIAAVEKTVANGGGVVLSIAKTLDAFKK